MTTTRRQLLASGLSAAQLFTASAMLSKTASAAPATDEAQPRWDPKKTWVFAVGVINYPDGAHWPEKGRRDRTLIAQLEASGVPRKQIVFIKDDQARYEEVKTAFEGTLAEAPADATLWFYFAGHGQKAKSGTSEFVLYDKPWPLPSVFADIEHLFKGETALLFADCCYSGSLGMEALLRAGRVAYGVLTSSLASTLSTGEWTFTDCLIAALKGEVPRQGGRTGHLTMSDLAYFAEREMAFTEEQLSTFVATNGFDPHFVLTPSAALSGPRAGQYIEAKWSDGKWYRASIEKAEGSRVYVRWLFSPRWPNEWVESANTRDLTFKRLPPGERVKVEWNGTWYPAEVLTERWGLHLVHYDGFEPIWDEWVAPKRIRTA